MVFDILRSPTDAEREVSNAIAAIDEAMITLRQFAPDSLALTYPWWDKEMRKLKTARGLCVNVRIALTTIPAFRRLRG